MNKQISFLSGIFRCGNTLLRSILNQNPNLFVSPNSFIPEIILILHRVKETHQFKDWKHIDVDVKHPNNEEYYNSVIKNVFNNYYSNFKEKYIIDQGRWGAPGNFDLLRKYHFLPKKFIMLFRPFEDIVKSWLRVNDIPKYRITIACDELMSEYGALGHSILALENLLKYQSENLLLISYDKLCVDPKKEIDKIYKFLDIPLYKNHKFKNLKQVDDNGNKPTTIRTNKIEKINYKNDIVIPETILKKYSKEVELLKGLNEIY